MMSLKYILSSLVILALILLYIRTYIRSVYLAFKLAGPPALPIIGNVHLLNNDREMFNIGNEAAERYGPFMRIWISLLPCVFIYEPKHLNIVLGTNKYSRKSIFYKFLHNFLGQGLITNNGYAWKKNRKMIQPLFHANIQEIFVETFQNCAEAFVTKLEGLSDVKITSLVNDCVLDILHNAILGVPLDSNSPYRKGEVLLNDRLKKPWLLLESIFMRTSSSQKEKEQKICLHSYTKNVLLERRRLAHPTGKCFLDMFIEIAENNPEFTDEDIINEIVTFMLAGQDSLGSAVAFTLFYLAKHQDVQTRVLEEMSQFDDRIRLSSKDLVGMKYLEQVVKETMRLAPSVPIFARVITEDLVLDGVDFPRGTNIFISPFVTHRLPHIYPNPSKFDPERFSPENIQKRHPFAYLPFSLGPRKCIGYQFALMEMKTIIFAVLKKYELSLVPGHEDYSLTYRTTLRARGGIWIHLNSRT